MARARCWIPAGLSGFFVPHITDDVRTTGACGGGFALDRGVEVEVAIEYIDGDRVEVINRINGVGIESKLARYVVERIVEKYGLQKGIRVLIEQRIDVPIGGGYGTSGASALGIALALAKAAKVRATLLDLAMAAHEADIASRTGLGTVVGLLGPKHGIVLVVKAGGPGTAVVDCIPMDSSLYVVTAFYGAKDKTEILSNIHTLSFIRDVGLKTLRRVLETPSPEVFAEQCEEFARRTGLMISRISRVIEEAKRLEGVLGGSMNMIGDGLFLIVEKDRVEDVVHIIESVEKPRWVHWFRPGIGCEIRC